MTLECARCHDHKYDPIQQREYFQLFAFFNSINEAGQAPYSGMASPTVILPSAEADARLDALRAERLALEQAMTAAATGYDAGFDAWLRGSARTASSLPSTDGLVVHLPLDGNRPGKILVKDKEGKGKLVPMLTFANLGSSRTPAFLGGDEDRAPETVPGRLGGAQRLRGDSEIKSPEGAAFFERNQPFSLATWFRIDKAGTAGPLIARSGSFANGYRGYLVRLEADGTLTAALHHVAPDDSIEIRTADPMPVTQWRHLSLTYDGSSRAAGLRLFLDGRPVPTKTVVDNLQRSLINSGIEGRQMSGAPLGLRLGSLGELSKESLRDVTVEDFRAYGRQLSDLEVATLATGTDALPALLAAPGAELLASDRARLRQHYLLRVDAAYRTRLDAITKVRGEENTILTAQPSVMAMRELPAARPTFILARGAYDAPRAGHSRYAESDPAVAPGPAAQPSRPRALAAGAGQSADGTGVRQSYWAMAFGRGLVATADDFGSQGRMPSHPELLDWLATRFVKSGWNAKALQKHIVMSATYRQSSLAAEQARAADPENIWLGRGPAFRMPIEEVRDTALAASGLLVRRIGGPSVYPYQPDGVWESLAAGAKYPLSTGADLYRRSLYTAWKRAAPPPSAIGFDASERLTCIVTRQRTNTPQQALILLNDPQFVEGARILAEQLMRDGTTPADRVTLAFRRVITRGPSASEVTQLTRLYETTREGFAAAPDSAVALLATGERPRDPTLAPTELAAWTIVASTIMNLDEAVFSR